ncbi:MAG: DUF664 domain-containing protein [Candidatus Eisenbacteria bacterium]|nr:DUF664 domain-containing protein [Candidatus Eisenbacteria bacterium]
MGRTVSLVAPSGFTPAIGARLAELDDVRRETHRYAAGLSPAQLAWTPHPKVESIATQLLHIAAVERSWIGEDLERRPMGEEWAPAFALRTGQPQIDGHDLAYFVERLDAMREETRRALATLSDADLTREIQCLDAPPESERFTLDWILHHLIEHEAHHRGQIALLKRLLPI